MQTAGFVRIITYNKAINSVKGKEAVKSLEDYYKGKVNRYS